MANLDFVGQSLTVGQCMVLCAPVLSKMDIFMKILQTFTDRIYKFSWFFDNHNPSRDLSLICSRSVAEILVDSEGLARIFFTGNLERFYQDITDESFFGWLNVVSIARPIDCEPPGRTYELYLLEETYSETPLF